MENSLGNLLEEMEKRYPNNITIKELKGLGFSESIIIESLDKGFIDYPHNMQDYTLQDAKRDDTMFVLLTSAGFLTLNQMRMKKSTDELNTNIIKFEKSSSFASKVMIWLTIAILFLTGFMAWLTWKLFLQG